MGLQFPFKSGCDFILNTMLIQTTFVSFPSFLYPFCLGKQANISLFAQRIYLLSVKLGNNWMKFVTDVSYQKIFKLVYLLTKLFAVIST